MAIRFYHDHEIIGVIWLPDRVVRVRRYDKIEITEAARDSYDGRFIRPPRRYTIIYNDHPIAIGVSLNRFPGRRHPYIIHFRVIP